MNFKTYLLSTILKTNGNDKQAAEGTILNNNVANQLSKSNYYNLKSKQTLLYNKSNMFLERDNKDGN